MKKTIFVLSFMSVTFLHADFLQNKMDQADVALFDIMEHVQQNYIPCPQEDVEEVRSHVKNLIADAIDQNGKRMRVNTFISLCFRFDNVGKEHKSYAFFSLFYAEIDPAQLVHLPSDDLDNLEQKLTKKLIDLYEQNRIGVEKIFTGCYVACIQSGVEEIV